MLAIVLLAFATTFLLDSCNALSIALAPTEGIATLGQFPYHVSIGVEYALRNGTTRTIIHHCGGSIISKNWILTAANCFTLTEQDENENLYKISPDDYSKITIKAGMINGPEPGPQVQDFQVLLANARDNLLVHEKWQAKSENSRDFDFALIKLAGADEFKFVEGQVGPIQLVKKGEVEPKAGDVGVVAGWGATSHGNLLSELLNWQEVPILPDENCRASFSWEVETESGEIKAQTDWHPEVQICAGAFTGTDIDSHQGDSGSALAFTFGGKRKLVGTASFGGHFTDQGEFPAVYAKVSAVLDWIAGKTGIDTA